MVRLVTPGTHKCPRPSCEQIVPDRTFSCRDDWFALPSELRSRIHRTARLSLLNKDRRQAVLDAVNWYREQDERVK